MQREVNRRDWTPISFGTYSSMSRGAADSKRMHCVWRVRWGSSCLGCRGKRDRRCELRYAFGEIAGGISVASLRAMWAIAHCAL